MNRISILALTLSGCSNAAAGYYGSGYLGDAGGGGGGVSGASRVTLVDIDFTAETTGAFTNAADNLLDDGTTNFYGCSVAGTAEIDANGLHFSHTTTSLVCLQLSSLASLTNLGDDDARGRLIITAQYDTANSFGTPGSGDGANFGIYTDGEGLSAGSGRMALLGTMVYNGATWDADSFGHDGQASTNATQAGAIADFPEYAMMSIYGRDMEAIWGDAASFPTTEADLTVQGVSVAGQRRADAFASQLTLGDTVTYEPSILLGLGSGGGEVTISRLRVEQVQ